MNQRKHRLSKAQRLHLFATFFLIRDQVLDGGLQPDRYPHVVGATPIPGRGHEGEFIFVLEKDGVPGSVAMQTKLAADGGSIKTWCHMKHLDGELVHGELEELMGRTDKVEIQPLLDKTETAMQMFQAMRCKAGRQLCLKFQPSPEQYRMLRQQQPEQLDPLYCVQDSAAYEGVKEEHRQAVARYVFVPREDGLPRSLNRAEWLMVHYLFYLKVSREGGNSFDYARAQDRISLDTASQQPVAEVCYVNMVDNSHYVNIEVTGQLNAVAPEDIRYYGADRKTGERTYFSTIAEAAAAPVCRLEANA